MLSDWDFALSNVVQQEQGRSGANPHQPPPTPTLQVGWLVPCPLSSWQCRPRGGEARLADTRHAECRMIYLDNFFPNKFTGKVNCEIFAEQRTRGQQEAFFVIFFVETRMRFSPIQSPTSIQDKNFWHSVSGFKTRPRKISFHIRDKIEK